MQLGDQSWREYAAFIILINPTPQWSLLPIKVQKLVA